MLDRNTNMISCVLISCYTQIGTALAAVDEETTETPLPLNARCFIMKPDCYAEIEASYQSGILCPSPQISNRVVNASKEGPVALIFSLNNSHAFQGYAEVDADKTLASKSAVSIETLPIYELLGLNCIFVETVISMEETLCASGRSYTRYPKQIQRESASEDVARWAGIIWLKPDMIISTEC